jgi:hypothetical protein
MPHSAPVDTTRNRQSLAVAIWTVLSLADAVLVSRRISGGFVSVIPGSLAFFTAALVALASWSAWYLYAAGSSLQPRSRRLIPQALAVAVTVLWAWPISARAAPLTVGLLAAVVLLHVAAIALHETEADFLTIVRPDLLAVPRPAMTTSVPTVTAVSPAVPEPFTVLDHLNRSSDEEPMEEADDSQTLWLSRRVTEAGEEIEGWVRVHFALGQRETTVHVSFCPPLGSTPELETEDLEGVGLEIRIAATFPFGARLAVRRSGPLDESHTDRIGFIARAESANRAA